MYRSLQGVTVLTICLLTSSQALGQFVRVGGGGGVRVRAPFVSVDVLPFRGGTRVRAPFTSVRTRAYRYGVGRYYAAPYAAYSAPVYARPYVYPRPVYANPAVARTASDSAYESARPTPAVSSDRNSIADRLVAAADQLTRSLQSRRDDADVWLDYLRPEQIADAAESGQAPDSLAPLLRNYEGVTGNSSLASIWSAAGFRQTYDLLQRYVASPDVDAANSNRVDDARAESDSPVPAPQEPRVAKPISPAIEDLPIDAEVIRKDEQGEEQSLLLPPPKSL